MPQTMKFPVKELAKIIKKNRDEHRQLFLKAQEGYREDITKELEMMLAEARAGKRYRRAVQLVEPMDMTREYDRILKMLELTTETEIELNPTEFSQYVMDDWGWKQAVTSTNQQYIKGG